MTTTSPRTYPAYTWDVDANGDPVPDGFAHGHGTRAVAGYNVIRTSWGRPDGATLRALDQYVDGATNYAAALARRDQVLACIGQGEMRHAVISPVYVCGCREPLGLILPAERSAADDAADLLELEESERSVMADALDAGRW